MGPEEGVVIAVSRTPGWGIFASGTSLSDVSFLPRV
jgi:hypothetical protein